MTDSTYDIQQLVNTSGVPRRTIYFYVQQGILPPPEGAGLAAHYREDHLLRLKLIPILRQQGLRLDDIRARFSQVDTDALRGMLAADSANRVNPAQLPRKISEARVPVLPDVPDGWGEQRYTHYTLPAGISLVAPDDLSVGDRQRLRMLLRAAQQIFNGGQYVYQDADASLSSPGIQPGDRPAQSTEEV